MQRMLFVLLLAACQEEIANEPVAEDVPVLRDLDGDGYGRLYNKYNEVQPAQSPADDCEDGDPAVFPGAEAPNVPCKGPMWAEDSA